MSSIWQHFTKLNDCAICLLCPKLKPPRVGRLKMKASSTRSLWTHLEAFHKDEHDILIKEKEAKKRKHEDELARLPKISKFLSESSTLNACEATTSQKSQESGQANKQIQIDDAFGIFLIGVFQVQNSEFITKSIFSCLH